MDIKFPPLPERIAQQISWFVKLVGYKPIPCNTTNYSSVADNTNIIIIQSYTGLHLGGRDICPLPPLCQNLAPLRTCEHCMRCESKTSNAPPSFLTVNICPLLTAFLNEPLLMNTSRVIAIYNCYKYAAQVTIQTATNV